MPSPSSPVAASSPAAAELALLRDHRGSVAALLDQLDADARAAASALTGARSELVRLEARSADGGVTAKERQAAEHVLSEAGRRAGEPWPERLEGARAAVRLADRQIQQFAADHLDELVADAEADATEAAAAVNAAAGALAGAIIELEHAAGNVGQVLAMGGVRPRPGAVTRTVTEQLARELGAFLDRGGQPPIRLDRTRVPALAAAQPDDGGPSSGDEPAPVDVA